MNDAVLRRVVLAVAGFVMAIGMAWAADPDVPLRVPPLTSIPAGALGDAVRLGQSIFDRQGAGHGADRLEQRAARFLIQPAPAE